MDEGAFDGVCICTGTNTWASLPCFKGQETFKGEIMHSEKYRSADVRPSVPHLPLCFLTTMVHFGGLKSGAYLYI